MTIPEVSTRLRLLGFLRQFLHKLDLLDQTLQISTNDAIALSASTLSISDNLNTVKAVGKWPLQLVQNQADGYGLYVKRDNSTDSETYPLILALEQNASSAEPILVLDSKSEAVPIREGNGTIFEIWTLGPASTVGASLYVDNRGKITMGGDQGASQGVGTHMLDLKTTSYFGPQTFSGGLLDDLTAISIGYQGQDGTGQVDYRIQIDNFGAQDTFKWSNDGGSTWIATGQDCTTTLYLLENGIYISFGAITGHAPGNYWDVPVVVVNPLRIRDAAGNDIFSIDNAANLWTAVTFATNWEDLSTSYEDCSYYKDPAGFVHIRGLAQCATGTTPSDTIFTLPTGYRPSRTGIYACRSNDTANGDTTCAVIIDAGNGTVRATSDFTPASDAYVSLAGIVFDTRAAT